MSLMNWFPGRTAITIQLKLCAINFMAPPPALPPPPHRCRHSNPSWRGTMVAWRVDDCSTFAQKGSRGFLMGHIRVRGALGMWWLKARGGGGADGAPVSRKWGLSGVPPPTLKTLLGWHRNTESTLCHPNYSQTLSLSESSGLFMIRISYRDH